MDPEATLQIILDATADIEDRLDACANLQTWLARGGARPLGMGIRLKAALATWGKTGQTLPRAVVRILASDSQHKRKE